MGSDCHAPIHMVDPRQRTQIFGDPSFFKSFPSCKYSSLSPIVSSLACWWHAEIQATLETAEYLHWQLQVSGGYSQGGAEGA